MSKALDAYKYNVRTVERTCSYNVAPQCTALHCTQVCADNSRSHCSSTLLNKSNTQYLPFTDGYQFISLYAKCISQFMYYVFAMYVCTYILLLLFK